MEFMYIYDNCPRFYHGKLKGEVDLRNEELSEGM